MDALQIVISILVLAGIAFILLFVVQQIEKIITKNKKK